LKQNTVVQTDLNRMCYLCTAFCIVWSFVCCHIWLYNFSFI